jgi:photosystem II stability/assembly factor-like uncharacterized protein
LAGLLASCGAKPLPAPRPFTLDWVTSPAPVVIDAPATEAACTDAWCWENPRPQGNDWNAVWGTRSSDVWAAGDAGTLGHFDGSRWTIFRLGGDDLHAVWGLTSDDVWASGHDRVLHWNGRAWSEVPTGLTNIGPLKSIAGLASNDVWIGCGYSNRPVLLHWNGQALQSIDAILPALVQRTTDGILAFDSSHRFRWNGRQWETLGDARSVRAVWGASQNFWAVTQKGVELVSGGSLTEFALPSRHPFGGPPDRADLNAIWASGPGDVWVAGARGRLLRSTDGGWREQSLGVQEAWRHDLNGVWGSSANDVWAVGSNGATFHYDGEAVTSQLDPTETLHDASFSNSGEGWAATNDGLLHRDAHAIWSRHVMDLEGLRSDSFSAVFVVEGDVWAAGSEIVRRRAGQWRDMAEKTNFRMLGLGTWRAIWGASADDVWVLGDMGLLHFTERGPQLTPGLGASYPARLVGTARNDVWLLRDKELLHFDGAIWQASPAETPGRWLDIWARAPNDVWLVGTQGVSHYNGSEWQPVPVSAASFEGESLRAVGGAGAHDVWVLGTEHLFHYDGRKWSSSRKPRLGLTRFVAGPELSLFAVGAGGAILRHQRDWKSRR